MPDPVPRTRADDLAEIVGRHGACPQRIAGYPIVYRTADGLALCHFCASYDEDAVDFHPNYAAVPACDRCGEPLIPLFQGTVLPGHCVTQCPSRAGH